MRAWTLTEVLEAWARVESGGVRRARPIGLDRHSRRPGLSADEQAFQRVAACSRYPRAYPALWWAFLGPGGPFDPAAYLAAQHRRGDPERLACAPMALSELVAELEGRASWDPFRPMVHEPECNADDWETETRQQSLLASIRRLERLSEGRDPGHWRTKRDARALERARQELHRLRDEARGAKARQDAP